MPTWATFNPNGYRLSLKEYSADIFTPTVCYIVHIYKYIIIIIIIEMGAD